jgi:hypothetical protein
VKCNWCDKNEVGFELIIYHLRKEEGSVIIPESSGKKIEQLRRDGMYLKVQLCEQCLPCTATNNPIRTKLRGREIKQPQTDQK